MHKCYENRTACTNKLLKKRHDTTYYNEHRRLVDSAPAMVDTSPPQTYMHLHLKLKKMQLEEERLATIERDNRILLEKMSYIMRGPARIDSQNFYQQKSLNTTKRNREQIRIANENQKMVRRITNKKPLYDHNDHASDFMKSVAHMERISHYPKDWYEQTQAEKEKRRLLHRQTKSQPLPGIRAGRRDTSDHTAEDGHSRRASAADAAPGRTESAASDRPDEKEDLKEES